MTTMANNRQATNTNLLNSMNDSLKFLADSQKAFNDKYMFGENKHNEIISNFRRHLRNKQYAESNKLSMYNRVLADCSQDTTNKCSCGDNHKGIKFIADNGVVAEDNMCPRVWYIKLVRMALEDGHGTEFTKNTPYNTFMRYYRNGK
jgi:hypothetical protein